MKQRRKSQSKEVLSSRTTVGKSVVNPKEFFEEQHEMHFRRNFNPPAAILCGHKFAS